MFDILSEVKTFVRHFFLQATVCQFVTNHMFPSEHDADNALCNLTFLLQWQARMSNNYRTAIQNIE